MSECACACVCVWVRFMGEADGGLQGATHDSLRLPGLKVLNTVDINTSIFLS